MSAIVAVFGVASVAPSPALARRMLDPMRQRGSDLAEVWVDGGALIAVARQRWEATDAHAGPSLIARAGDLLVAADATLYYRTELLEKLDRAGVRAADRSASALILASYQAWGDDCASHLDGDFAFIVWNNRRGRVLLARDFVGRRTLHFAEVGGALIVASTAGAVAAHPGCSRELDLFTIAAATGGLLGGSLKTAYRAVHPVQAGTSMSWSANDRMREIRRWQPPPFAIVASPGAPSEAEAAEELRALIARAVAERSSSDGTTVWLSGGADSTAVFAAGHHYRETTGVGPEIGAVSLTFPSGDTAREDEHIAAVAERWRVAVRWLDSERIPLLDGVSVRAARRDDPYAHTFEQCNRALARTTRDEGSRVVLDGYGGDHLFQVSDAFLSDLLLAGRWRTLARELRGRGYKDPRSAFRWSVQPVLPTPLLRVATLLRQGKPLNAYLEQALPGWVRPEFSGSDEIGRRVRPELRRGWLEGGAAYESRWYATTPYMARAVGWAYGLAQEEGVEVRSPLFDRRIVEFAASRPLLERASSSATKVLLRRSMRGLIPDSVLAPRPFKTGIPRGYLHRRMRDEFPALFEEVFPARRRSLLAELGIVDQEALRNAHEEYRATTDHISGVQLYLTLQTELWLRARM